MGGGRVGHPVRQAIYRHGVRRSLLAGRQVDIRPRSDWAGDLEPVGPIEAEPDVRFLIVHHTVASNSYAEGDVAPTLRSYFNFHTSAEKGWPDIAYNFLVDRFGVVWEGRKGSIAGPVQGSATGGSQGFALLCAFIGDHSSEPPSAAAVDSMGRLLGQLASRYGIDVSPGATTTFVSRGSNRHARGAEVTTPTISPHRAMSQTSCPGEAGVRVITDQLIPIASGGAAAVAAESTTTTEATTTTEETTTTEASTTSESTTATVADEAVSDETLAEESTTTESVSTTTEAAEFAAPDTTSASAPTSARSTASTAAEAVGEEAAASAGGADDGTSLVRVGGPLGLVGVGLAGLLALRRRNVSE